MGYSPWSCKESDTTEQLSMHMHINARELRVGLSKADIHELEVHFVDHVKKGSV